MLAPILRLVGDLRPTQRRSLKLREIWAEHECQLVELLCGLDRSSRVNRFGHPASDAGVEAYAKGAIVSAAFIAGVFAQGRIIVEVFEASHDGIAKAAFAVATDWRRQGLGSDQQPGDGRISPASEH